jgi:hypothetical protein
MAMNTEFIVDLIGACRSDPERFKDLLAANALADILQMMVNRIEGLEREITRASNYSTPALPGQFVDIPPGAPPRQWQEMLLQQLQAMKQDQAKLMGLSSPWYSRR